MASYKEFQSKLLDKYLKDIVFLELKEDRTLSVGDAQLDKKIPIPVYLQDLAFNIKNDQIDNIPVVAIIKGLVTYLGVDEDEKGFKDTYVKMLTGIDTDIVLNILTDAVKHAEQMNYLNAILFFNAVLQIDEANLDALFNIGRCYMDLAVENEMDDMYRMAKIYFEKTLEVDSQLYEAYYHLGFCYYNDQTYQKAEEVWKNALRGDLSQEMREEIVVALGRVRDKALFERGRDLILAQRVDEGLELLKTIEEEHDEWWELLFFIGLGYRVSELYEEAIPYFLKVMTLNTGHAQSLNELGVCFLSIGDLSAAKDYFKEALKLSPNSSEYLVNYGIVYFTEGDLLTARDYFTKALEQDSKDEVAMMWMDHLNKQLN